MNTIDQYNIGLIVIATIIYIVLCYNTRYRSIFYNNNKLTEAEYRMLYFTTVFGFIYGTILASFQQRYLDRNITNVWLWVFTLFVCILLIFSAFYSQVFTEEDTNSFLGKFSFAIVPILPSLVMISESSISQILDYGVNNKMNESETDSFNNYLDS